MTGTIWKLSAGDGYTYLTRQVAVLDSTERARSDLNSYYTDKGEVAGRWRGNGVSSLAAVPDSNGVETRLSAGDVVTEAQMKALFGEGIHPLADAFDAVHAGDPKAARKASRLGRSYMQNDGRPSPFERALAIRYRTWLTENGLSSRAAVPAQVRSELRTEVATKSFIETYGREPLGERELSGHLAKVSRPAPDAVAGFDLTFSPVKSVSVLWAIADKPVADQIVAAHDAAVAEAMRYLEAECAFTRSGAGGVRHEDVTGVIAAEFRHRDSRAGDPDLHSHVAVSNKVQTLDGRWLALDGAVLYRSMVSISERYNTALEAELVTRLGVEFVERAPQMEGGRSIREVAGIPQELSDEMSSRRQSIVARRGELERSFVVTHGRAPTPKELLELAQQANLETREAKHEPRSESDQRAAWRETAVAVLGSDRTVEQVVAESVGRRLEAAVVATPALREQWVRQAVERVALSRARFAQRHVRAELERVVRAAGVAPGMTAHVVDECSREAAQHPMVVALDVTVGGVEEPAALRRADGASMYQAPQSLLFTTTEVLAAEQRIVDAAGRFDGVQLDEQTLDLAMLESAANGVTLNAGQRVMVRELTTSGARVQLLLAPAGSGKTTALGVLRRAWNDGGGQVLALAPSAAAARELGSSIDAPADTLAKLIWHLEHEQEPLPGWAAAVDDTTMIVIDEAGMASTRDLDLVLAFAAQRGAQVRLVGDDQQLAAIGAGGVLRDIAHQHGAATLSEVLRFTNPSEGEASLAIREGNLSGLGFYLDQGRVHSHTELSAVGAAFSAWKGDTADGLTSLMLASTGETVGELNRLGQAEMLLRGRVDHSQVIELRGHQLVGRGDRIVTRRNSRRLQVSATDWVKNGDGWTVTGVGAAGELEVVSDTGRTVTLPAEYVSAHVDLGYARTVHAAQGATVDTCHSVIDGSEARQHFYVAMTRGRRGNHSYVVVPGVTDAHQGINPGAYIARSAVEVIEQVLRRDGAQQSATTTLREAADPVVQLRHVSELYRDALGVALLDVAGQQLVDHVHEAAERAVPGVTTCGGWDALRTRLLCAAVDGVDVDRLLQAAAEQPLGETRDEAAVLHARLGTLHDDRSPWLLPRPAAVASHETWGPYLAARADLVAAAGAAVPVIEDSPWVQQALLSGVPRSQVQHLARFRAAMGIAVDDPAPAGSQPLPGELGMVQRRLARTAPTSPTLTPAWPDPKEGIRVMDDPYWPVLARRFAAAAAVGADVDSLIEKALEAGPLPDDYPAAALAYRLAGELPDVDVEAQLPRWATLLQQDRRPVDDVTTTSSAWRELDSITAEIPPAIAEQLLTDAIALMPRHAGMDSEQQLVWLTWRLEQLTASTDNAEPPTVDEAVDRPDVTADPETVPMHSGTSKDRIVELHEEAAAYYRDQYRDSAAAAYIASRFGTDLTDVNDLVIGYAPAKGLVDVLTKQGATPDELVDAGLASYRRGGLQDVFRDRVVIGLHDQAGALVGFTGRAAPGSDAPKYLNTRSTTAFRKGEVLFGMQQLDQHPAAGVVRCEGVFDAIAVTLAGDGAAIGVAPMGTALTDAQAELIADRAHDLPVLLATDSDEAGQKALHRDYWALSKVGVATATLVLPPGANDPAEAWQEDAEALGLAVANPAVSPAAASKLLLDLAAEPLLAEGVIDANKAAAAAKRAAAIIAADPDVTSYEDHVGQVVEQIPFDGIDEMVRGHLAAMEQAEEPVAVATAAAPPTVSPELARRIMALKERVTAQAEATKAKVANAPSLGQALAERTSSAETTDAGDELHQEQTIEGQTHRPDRDGPSLDQ